MTLPAAAISLQNAIEALGSHHLPFISLFQSRELDVELYRPHKVDLQTPHDRDELYVVVAGSGEFICGTERRRFQAGDVLIVPAHVEHRFMDFSDDFATWVVFFGPPKQPA